MGVQLLEKVSLLPLYHVRVYFLQELLKLGEHYFFSLLEPEVHPEGLQIDILWIDFKAEIAHYLGILIFELNILADERIEIAIEDGMLE